eukprot:6491086-Lingulodinium_polyedra.AAC.1
MNSGAFQQFHGGRNCFAHGRRYPTGPHYVLCPERPAAAHPAFVFRTAETTGPEAESESKSE